MSGVRCPADEPKVKRCHRRPATGIPPDTGPHFFFARRSYVISKAEEAEDARDARVLMAILRLCDGDPSSFRVAEAPPEEIERFLDRGPSLRARRTALLAILHTIINDEPFNW